MQIILQNNEIKYCIAHRLDAKAALVEIFICSLKKQVWPYLIFNIFIAKIFIIDTEKLKEKKCSVGDLVRISHAKNIFHKSYEGGKTLFKISRISTTHQPPVYYLQDSSKKIIDCFFNKKQLSQVRKDLQRTQLKSI